MDKIQSILITIVAGIYELASWCFEIFVNLSRIPVISSDKYQVLIQNLYILVGVVVLFFISFSILKAMVDPGKTESETKDSSNILLKIVSSVVLLIFVPTIFNFAFQVQNSIINYNTIGKLFGNSSTFSTIDDSEDFIKNAGNTLSNQIFMAFFTPNEDFCEEKGKDDSMECAGLIESGSFWGEKTTLSDAYSSVDNGKSFMIYNDFGGEVEDDEISFNFLVSLIAGGFLCYVIVSFCFDLAIRMVKLIFMQLIAPLPIMLRIAPNSKMSSVFNQWLKICGSCYLEVFVRLIAIYFCLYIVTLVPDIISEINGGFMLTAFLYLGLIAFMRQMPNLLKDVFGIDSSSLKLGIKDKLAAGGLFAAGGAIGSFATRLAADYKGSKAAAISNGKSKFKSSASGFGGAAKNIFGAFASGYRGWKSGVSNIGAEMQARKNYYDTKAAGVKDSQILKDKFTSSLGFSTSAEREKTQIEENDYSVKNEAGVEFEYTKANGSKVIVAENQEYKINAGDIEAMEAKKLENVSEISKVRDTIKKLDAEAQFGTGRIQHKSNLKSEAEKKIDEAGSKRTYTLKYKKNGKERTFTGTYEQILHFKNNDLTVEQRQLVASDESIRDEMIKEFIRDEYALNDSKIKQDMNAGFQSIINNDGYTFNIDDTNKVRLNVKFDNNEWCVDYDTTMIIDENGNERVIDNETIEKLKLTSDKNNYSLVDQIDKLAKTSNGIINAKKQNLQETTIAEIEAKNEAMDSLIKQFNDAKDADLHSQLMRQKEISSKYISSNNNNK